MKVLRVRVRVRVRVNRSEPIPSWCPSLNFSQCDQIFFAHHDSSFLGFFHSYFFLQVFHFAQPSCSNVHCFSYFSNFFVSSSPMPSDLRKDSEGNLFFLFGFRFLSRQTSASLSIILSFNFL